MTPKEVGDAAKCPVVHGLLLNKRSPSGLVSYGMLKFQDGCTDYYQWNIYGHKVAPNMSTVDFYDTNALQMERG